MSYDKRKDSAADLTAKLKGSLSSKQRRVNRVCSLAALATPPLSTLIFILRRHRAHFPILIELNPGWRCVASWPLTPVLSFHVDLLTPYLPTASHQPPSEGWGGGEGGGGCSEDLAVAPSTVRAKGEIKWPIKGRTAR